MLDLTDIDLELLKKQKQSLFETIQIAALDKQEHLEGILNLLDYIQDNIENNA